MRTFVNKEQTPISFDFIGLLASLGAIVAIFLPFAAQTSPWNAVTLRVPGNQGNLWHFLIGAPFFLVFAMIWLRLQSIFSRSSLSLAGRRFVWVLVALSVCGTMTVEVPFILRLGNFAHLGIERVLSVVCFGLGPMAVCGLILLLRLRNISPSNACFVGLNGAWLANAGLCLYFYAPMREPGWTATIIFSCFMALEIAWIFLWSLRKRKTEDPLIPPKIDPSVIA